MSEWLSAMLSSSLGRAVAWGAAVVLLILSAALLWPSGVDAERAAPAPEQVERLRRLPVEQYGAWLAEYRDQLSPEVGPVEAFIIQTAADGAPVVLAAVPDAWGAELSPVNWSCPWPAVIAAMPAPPDTTTVIAGEHSDRDYVHQLLPLDVLGNRCLLINQLCPARSWWGFPSAAALGAITLIALLLFVRE